MTMKIKYFRKNQDGVKEMVIREYATEKYINICVCPVCHRSTINTSIGPHNNTVYHQTALKILEDSPNINNDELKKAIYQYRVKQHSDTSSSDDEEKKVKRKLQMDNVGRRHYDIKHGISNLVNKLSNLDKQSKHNLQRLKEYLIKYPRNAELLSVSHLLSTEDLELIELQTTIIPTTAPEYIPNIASYVMEQGSGITCF